MLQILIPLSEDFDEEASKFITSDGCTINLEHSLVSLSKWESEWEIPFLGSENKTDKQVLDYIRMMIVGEIPPAEILQKLSAENIMEIDKYINKKMTATWFRKEQSGINQEVVTSEIIYYWMISLGIPFECENWHLNRLLTLIRVCNIKNAPKKKMSKADVIAQQREINNLRRQQTGSRG